MGSVSLRFPYFFVGTFIEAVVSAETSSRRSAFPYFFVGTFIEATQRGGNQPTAAPRFPYFFVGTFIEALKNSVPAPHFIIISLLFRRDFH